MSNLTYNQSYLTYNQSYLKIHSFLYSKLELLNNKYWFIFSKIINDTSNNFHLYYITACSLRQRIYHLISCLELNKISNIDVKNSKLNELFDNFNIIYNLFIEKT